MDVNKLALFVDLTFFLIFLPLMILVFPIERWWGTYPRFFVLFVAWLCATYFIYRYYVIPQLCRTGKRYKISAGAVIMGTLVITFLLSSYNLTSPFYHLRQHTSESLPYPMWGARPNQQAVWLHFIIVVAYCAVVGTLSEAYRQRIARREMELARNKAELALYKSQINPHFLFNTLNTLYGLILSRSELAESAMEHFISLAKYLYNNASRDTIPIAEEAEYIDRFIALQRLRLHENVTINYTNELEHPELQVAPMLLITFVENAFKYGISSSEPCCIDIKLHERDRCLTFEVTNSVFEHNHTSSTRTGISNCRKRLALIYPGAHTLSCQLDDTGRYRVFLSIRL